MDLAAFERDGAVHFPAVLDVDALAHLCERLELELKGRPGRRLTGGLDAVLPTLTEAASQLIGPGAFPVRAVAFDKTPEANWSVAWHQDRTIAVRERLDAPGYGPWSVKDGIAHVEPPVTVMAGMVTLRLHLDDCDDDNSPLTVALGSHRTGSCAGVGGCRCGAFAAQSDLSREVRRCLGLFHAYSAYVGTIAA